MAGTEEVSTMRDGGLIAISDGCGNLVGGILSYKGQKEVCLVSRWCRKCLHSWWRGVCEVIVGTVSVGMQVDGIFALLALHVS